MWSILRTKQFKDNKRRKDVNKHFNNKGKQQREKPRKSKSDAHRSLGVLEAPAELRGAQFEPLA